MNPDQPTRLHYAWIIVAVACLVVFASLGLARFGYGVVLPAMQSDLGLNNAQAGLLASANFVGYLAMTLVGGMAATRFGPRYVISIGLALAGVSMIMTGLSSEFFFVALWRMLTGMGSGLSNVPVIGLLAAWFGSRRIGTATGLAVTGPSFALIGLGSLVPWTLEVFGDDGWRICWYAFGVTALLIGIAGFVLLTQQPEDKGLRPIAENPASTTNPADMKRHRPQWKTIYRSLTVWHLGMVYGGFGFSYMIYLTFFIKKLTAEAHYSDHAAGELFMLVGWCSLLCGVIFGTLSDVIGRNWALMITYLFHSTAFALFVLWPTDIGFTLSAIIFGLSAWSVPAIMAATCGELLGARLAPTALGFVTLFHSVGQVAGPYIAGVMADATGSFDSSFLLASAAALAAAIGAAFLRVKPLSDHDNQPRV